MAKTIKQVTWSTSVAAATDWFSADVSVGGAHPVKHILQAQLASATEQINLIMVRAGTTATIGLNNNADVSVGAMFQEAFIVIPGTTYNVQHTTTGQVVTGIIVEDEGDLNIS